MEYGFIYSIECKINGKYYIGQAKEFKSKNGKPFRYGIGGRWSDHLSSAKCGRATTPLANAIRTYGADAFVLKELQKASSTELDVLEMKWISDMNTLVPNGYNVCFHSYIHQKIPSLMARQYTDIVESAVLRPIRCNGEYSLMYVMLTFKDTTRATERITFGQKEGETFEEARDNALAFVRAVGCPFVEETTNSLNPLERYASKLKQFEGKLIRRIRITSASTLVAVYVTTADAKSYKDQIRICFGGKVVPQDVAYDIAKQFVNALDKNETTILEDQIRGQQQVAASEVETEP